MMGKGWCGMGWGRIRSLPQSEGCWDSDCLADGWQCLCADPGSQ